MSLKHDELPERTPVHVDVHGRQTILDQLQAESFGFEEIASPSSYSHCKNSQLLSSENCSNQFYRRQLLSLDGPGVCCMPHSYTVITGLLTKCEPVKMAGYGQVLFFACL